MQTEVARLLTLVTATLMEEMSDEQLRAAALKLGAVAINEGPSSSRTFLLTTAQAIEDYIEVRKLD